MTEDYLTHPERSPRPAPAQAAVRVSLWVGSWVGAALCAHQAHVSDPAYVWPAIFLVGVAVLPVVRELLQRRASPRTGRLPSPRPPSLDAEGLRQTGAGRDVLAWSEVVRIELVTAGRAAGPDGLRFVVTPAGSHPAVALTAAQSHECGLLAGVEAYLGVLDERAMLAGLAARGPGSHLLWQRGGHAPRFGFDAPAPV